MTPAHKTSKLAELVCSNSLGSLSTDNAKGELLFELKVLGSSLVNLAFEAQIGGDKALVVDRELFSTLVEDAVRSHRNITVVRAEITEIPKDVPCIIAPGPLIKGDLLHFLEEREGRCELNITMPLVLAFFLKPLTWITLFGEIGLEKAVTT